MRVALISFHTSPLATLGGKDTGGMNVYVREIARELGRRNIQVDIFTRSNSPHNLRIDPRLGQNVRVIHVPAGPEAPVSKNDLHQYVPAFTEWMCAFAEEIGDWRLQNAVAATAAIDNPKSGIQNPYDVIHANYWLSGLVADNLRKCWGTRYVLTYHTLAELKNQIAEREQDRESDLRLKNECNLSNLADRLTANTTVEKQQLVRFYGAPSSRIRIVPPGVDLSRFSPIEQSYAKSVIGIPRQHRMILFAGRIERLKGIDTLFRAMAILKQRRREWDWDNMCVSVIGGDPSEEGQRENEEMGRLHALRDELGLENVIAFLGARDQDALHFYFSAAELLVMPSHYESFGMVALEAMACGTPVIASDVGGLTTLVLDGKNGYRVKVNDAEAMAKAIERLMDNEALRRRMGHRASCYAEDYSWPKVVDKLLDVYGELA
jgi:D-inositol-3-phosphate glycosyltransferase